VYSVWCGDCGVVGILLVIADTRYWPFSSSSKLDGDRIKVLKCLSAT